jgi:hypothetical protein
VAVVKEVMNLFIEIREFVSVAEFKKGGRKYPSASAAPIPKHRVGEALNLTLSKTNEEGFASFFIKMKDAIWTRAIGRSFLPQRSDDVGRTFGI